MLKLSAAFDNFGITPVEPLLQIDIEHDMIVVAHDRIGGNIDSVDASQHK
jgi:hypothetical protein